MQLKISCGIIIIILTLTVLVAGCANPPFPSPQASPSIAPTAITNASTTSAVPSSTVTTQTDYASILNKLGIGVGNITSPFQKSAMNGKEVYVGNVTIDGVLQNVQIYPMSSFSDALAFKEQMVRAYQAHAFVRDPNASPANSTVWRGIKQSTLSGSGQVHIAAMEKTKLGTPETEVLISPFVGTSLKDLIVQ